MNTPTKDDVQRLMGILEHNPLMGANALQRLPNEAMEGFNANHAARDMLTLERLAGGQHED